MRRNSFLVASFTILDECFYVGLPLEKNLRRDPKKTQRARKGSLELKGINENRVGSLGPKLWGSEVLATLQLKCTL